MEFVMEHGVFRAWLAEVDDLAVDQRRELEEVLAGQPSGAAVTTVIETSPGDERRCPHCGHGAAVGCGQADGLRRLRCKGCGRSFNALTGTPLARLRKKECWLDFGRSLSEGETVVTSAERSGVPHSTSLRWLHRFLTAPAASPILTGIVEADETFVLFSYKGSRVWERAEQGLPGAEAPDRAARGRGGKATKRGLSHEQVPILVAADRSGAVVSAVLPVDSADAIRAVLDPVLSKDALLVGGTALACCASGMKISHEVVNQSAGERVRGDLNIQTVNSLHERIKTFLRARRGVATKYLDNYLRWFHLAGLQHAPTPRACLNAAIGPQLKMAVPT